jgi:predicted nucleic acid-binding protein
MWAFIAGVDLMGSELLLTEVPRALRGSPDAGSSFRLGASLMQASILLEEAELYPVRREGLRRAGLIFEPKLRALDAIHVATALEVRSLWAFVTYDERQRKAALEAGLRVRSPGK